MTPEQIKEFIDQKLVELGEHCDAVQILVCWIGDDGSTRSEKRGCGLWHARQGLAHEFIQEDIAQDQAFQIGKQINPPDEGDQWKANQ